jgi:hypothetical protein
MARRVTAVTEVGERRAHLATDLGRVRAARGKRQPLGGAIGLGTSPSRTICSRGVSSSPVSMSGIAERSASV